MRQNEIAVSLDCFSCWAISFFRGGVVVPQIRNIIGHARISQTIERSGEIQEFYFTFDGHGSTRVLLDVAGAIAELNGIDQIFHYDAYGQAIGFVPSQAATEFLYSGEQFDAKIGQQYLRARYYDPATGRFNRLDPFFGNLTDPQSLHNYLYCHADPINGVDPSGELLSCMISVGIRVGSFAVAHPVMFSAISGGIIGAGIGGYFGGWKGALIGGVAGAGAGFVGAYSFIYLTAFAEYMAFSQIGSIFVAGSVSGILGGGTSGFVGGFANSFFRPEGDFYTAFYDALLQARFEAGIGGGLGGIIGPGIYICGNLKQVLSTRSASGAKAILEAERRANNVTSSSHAVMDSRLQQFLQQEEIAEQALKLAQQQNGPRSHFYSKHGAQTEMSDQWLRANTGLAPDGSGWSPTGTNMPTVNSSRFLTHQDQYRALTKAQSLYDPTKTQEIFDMGYTIGEGFAKESNNIFTTSKVQVYYDPNGNIITMFPLKPY